MVNLLSNDVNRLDAGLMFLHHIWIAPLEVILVVYILWSGYFGASCMAGMVVLGVYIPLQGEFSLRSRMFLTCSKS